MPQRGRAEQQRRLGQPGLDEPPGIVDRGRGRRAHNGHARHNAEHQRRREVLGRLAEEGFIERQQPQVRGQPAAQQHVAEVQQESVGLAGAPHGGLVGQVAAPQLGGGESQARQHQQAPGEVGDVPARHGCY